MAYVRPYQSQQEPSVIPGTPAAPLLDSESRNLADLGANLGQAQKVVYEADTQRAVMDAHGQLSQAMVDINDYQNKLKLSWAADGTNPAGYTPVIHKMVDDYGTKLIEQQTNPRARAYVAETFARMGMHQVEQADNWERQQIERYQVTQLDKQGDDYAKTIAGDTSQYALNKQIYTDAVANAKLTPDMREKLLEVGLKKFQAAAIQSHIENDPHGLFTLANKALGLKDTPPSLPSPTPTPGSSAAVVGGPVADQFGPIDPARPAIQNADGTFSTERTITVESDGKHYLIPTIVDGKQRSNDEAIALWRGGKNASVGTFDSNAQAEAAAVARSQEIGRRRGGDTGAAPGLTGGDAAAAAASQPIKMPWFTIHPHLQVPAMLQGQRDQARLALLQEEYADATKRKAAGDPHADADIAGLTKEIKREGATPGAAPKPAPVQVASSGEIATDAAPPSVLPLGPMHTSTGVKTGVPYIDELSTPQLVAARNEAHSRMLQGQSGARAELERQIQAAASAHKLGLDAAPIARSLVDAALPDKPTADAKWAEIRAWDHFGEDVQALHRIPDKQIKEYVEDTKPTDPSKPGFSALTERWAATAAAAHHVMQTRQDDPVAAMSLEKVGEPTAKLDLGDMNKFQAEVEKRARNSKVAQGVYLDRPLLWTKPEAKNLATTIAGAPFAVQTQFLATMRRAIPDNATFRGAVQQIYPHAPEIANAAVLASYNPGYPLAPGFAPPQQAAELVLRGEGILDPTKQQAEADNLKAGKLLMPDEQQLLQKFTAHVGDAYSDHPTALKDDFQAFRAAVAAIASRDGLVIDPTNKAPPDKVVQEALNASIGGIIQIGEHRAVKPYGMPDDVFMSRYSAAYNAELARNGMDPRNFPMGDYPPITAADGTYHIRQGAGYLRSPQTGEEITVNVPTDTDPLAWGPAVPRGFGQAGAARVAAREPGMPAPTLRYPQ
jgi:hypothetical protein